MTKEIPLTQGKVALVDDWDYERVARHKWSAVCMEKKHWYAKRCIPYDGKIINVYMHRFITGVPQGVHIDHIDGNGLNNTEANLRIATPKQNVANTRLAVNNTSGFKGVMVRKKSGVYVAGTVRSGKRVNLGTYQTAEEAARVYDAYVRLSAGEFAWTNFDTLCPKAEGIARSIANGGQPPSYRVKPHRKLTDEQVVEIRARYAAGGVLGKDLAAEYDVCIAAIFHLLSGRTFKDVGTPVSPERRNELHRLHVKEAKAVAA